MPGFTSNSWCSRRSHQQATEQVSISNSISSLRGLQSIDWREFVETLSIVEQILRRDPAGVHGATDFTTRDDYRHVVEKISKRSGVPEERVAELALELAREASPGVGRGPTDSPCGLLSRAGLERLNAATRAHAGIFENAVLAARRHPLVLYLGGVLLLAALTTAIVLTLLWGTTGAAVACGCRTLLLAGSAQMSLDLVNRITMLLVGPKRLPKMDFSAGIPPEYETMVAVPTMLSGRDAIRQLLDGLEVRYLANRQDNLLFQPADGLPRRAAGAYAG